MRFATLALLAAASLLAPTAVPTAAWAHHAFATEFDVNSPVTLTGTVTKLELINPHSWITLAVTDEDGVVTEWMFEGGSPNALVRRGITKNSVPIGSELVIEGYQARDGSNKAVGRNVTFSDGSQVFFYDGASPQQ